MTSAQIVAYFIAPLVMFAVCIGLGVLAEWRARHDIDPHAAE